MPTIRRANECRFDTQYFLESISGQGKSLPSSKERHQENTIHFLELGLDCEKVSLIAVIKLQHREQRTIFIGELYLSSRHENQGPEFTSK